MSLLVDTINLTPIKRQHGEICETIVTNREKKWVSVDETSLKIFRWMPVEDGVEDDSADLQPKSKIIRIDDEAKGGRLAARRIINQNLNDTFPSKTTPQHMIDFEDPFDVARMVTDQIVSRVSNISDSPMEH